MAVQHHPRVSGVSSVAENVHDSPVPALEGSNYHGCPSLSSSKELSGDSLRLCSSSREYLMQTAAEPTVKVDSPAIISTVRQESCSHADVNSQSRSGSFSGYPETSTNRMTYHLATQQTSDDSNESSSLKSESASWSPCCVFAGPESQNDPDSCYELTGGYYGKSPVTVVQSEMALEAFTDKIVSGIQSLLVKGCGTPSTIEAVIADGNTEDTLAAAGASAKQTPEVENTSAGSKSKKRVRAFFKRAWQAVKRTFVCGTRSDKIGPAV